MPDPAVPGPEIPKYEDRNLGLRLSFHNSGPVLSVLQRCLRRPHLAYDTADDQRDSVGPECGVNAEMFTDDRKQECRQADADTARGNGQAHTGSAQFRGEELRGIGIFGDNGHSQNQGKGGNHADGHHRRHILPQNEKNEQRSRNIERPHQKGAPAHIDKDPRTDKNAGHCEDIIKSAGSVGIVNVQFLEHEGNEDADGEEGKRLTAPDRAGNNGLPPLLRGKEAEPARRFHLFLFLGNEVAVTHESADNLLRPVLFSCGDQPLRRFRQAEADDLGNGRRNRGSADNPAPSVFSEPVHDKAHEVGNAVAESPEKQKPGKDGGAFFLGGPFAEQGNTCRVVRPHQQPEEEADRGQQNGIGNEELADGKSNEEKHDRGIKGPPADPVADHAREQTAEQDPGVRSRGENSHPEAG